MCAGQLHLSTGNLKNKNRKIVQYKMFPDILTEKTQARKKNLT